MHKRALILVLLLAGCATNQSAYVREGVQYGVTEGPFRGRWWSYYERGRSFLDGGFYEEARRDFERALDERDLDQRWARTYGLHFVPQYFPHREFGVALFYLDDLSGAVTALERSYDQQPSARATYFLSQARRKLAASLRDTEAPAVSVVAPDIAQPLAGGKLRWVFALTDNTYLDTFEVDGVNVPLGPPSPRAEASLELETRPGRNQLLIRAVDVAGNVTETPFEYAADFDGPLLSFDEPVALPGALHGVASDLSQVAALSVEGVEATLFQTGDHAYRFSVELTREQLTPPLTFTASDTLGNRSAGVLPLDVLKLADATPELRFASAPSVIPLGPQLAALYEGARLVAVAQVADADTGPEVRFTNLAEGQRYLLDEIMVDLDIIAANGVKTLTVNGAPVDIFPDRHRQRISRRVPLPAPGPVELVAIIEDTAGQTRETRVTIERTLTAVETLDRKLSLAVLGNVWEGPNRDTRSEEQFISDELTRLLFEQGRFDLVARDTLPQVLTEQELAAALGARNGASPLRDIVPAEMMAVGMVRKDPESVEIILQAINLDSSQLMGYADVAGKVETKDDLRRLVGDLARRFVQDFPRVQGKVVDIRANARVYTSLGAPDRIRRNMKCLVFRRGQEILDPATGAVLGAPTEIIAEGWFDEVAAQLSVVKVVPSPDTAGGPVEVQDYVITK